MAEAAVIARLRRQAGAAGASEDGDEATLEAIMRSESLLDSKFQEYQVLCLQVCLTIGLARLH